MNTMIFGLDLDKSSVSFGGDATFFIGKEWKVKRIGFLRFLPLKM